MATPGNLEAGTTQTALANEPHVTLDQKKSIFETVFGRELYETDDEIDYELMFQKIDEHASHKRDGVLTDAVIWANIECINWVIKFLRETMGVRWRDAVNMIYGTGYEYTRCPDRTGELRMVLDPSGYPDLAKVLEVAFDVWNHVKVPGQYLVTEMDRDNDSHFNWNESNSLASNMAVIFGADSSFSPGDDLSASDLERFYPVRIVRTTHLNNHLRYTRYPPDKEKPTLELFIDWSALAFLQRIGTSAPHAIPDRLAVEVSGMVSLMFKESRGTRRLIRTKIGKENSEHAKRAWRFVDRAQAPEQLQFYGFTDRLRYIHTLYHSSPDGWWHPLFDRRDREKHLALVIAVFAFVFALLSTATGALSGGYAVMQYNLAVDAACVEVGDSPRMAKYCN